MFKNKSCISPSLLLSSLVLSSNGPLFYVQDLEKWNPHIPRTGKSLFLSHQAYPVSIFYRPFLQSASSVSPPSFNIDTNMSIHGLITSYVKNYHAGSSACNTLSPLNSTGAFINTRSSIIFSKSLPVWGHLGTSVS